MNLMKKEYYLVQKFGIVKVDNVRYFNESLIKWIIEIVLYVCTGRSLISFGNALKWIYLNDRWVIKILSTNSVHIQFHNTNEQKNFDIWFQVLFFTESISYLQKSKL